MSENKTAKTPADGGSAFPTLQYVSGIHMTPAMALQAVLTRCELGEVTDVLIVGYDTDNDFVSFSSKMTRADAVWLLEKAKRWAME